MRGRRRNRIHREVERDRGAGRLYDIRVHGRSDLVTVSRLLLTDLFFFNLKSGTSSVSPELLHHFCAPGFTEEEVS